VREVASSNLAVPTSNIKHLRPSISVAVFALWQRWRWSDSSVLQRRLFGNSKTTNHVKREAAQTNQESVARTSSLVAGGRSLSIVSSEMIKKQ
jgi:hypothetical protein